MDADVTVRTMLALAGVAPPEDEIKELIAGYPATRESMAAMYALAELPGTDGVLVFRAAD